MRVIYISGSGRSGSTLLERILHATAGAMAVGEFHCLWRLPTSEINCSCGECVEADSFWRSTLARAGVGAGELVELQRLEGIVARSGFIARHGYSLSRLQQSPEVKRFLDLQSGLFSAIAEISGRGLIVDSSKAGPRAWIMACEPRVALLHLYRAPADVIASWRSRKFDQGLGADMPRLSHSRAALDWWKVEFLARRLASQRSIQMVDYRQLCLAPRQTIDAALAAQGLPPSRADAWLNDHMIVPTTEYHSLNGNPDRFDRDPIAIKLRRTDWSRYGFAERFAARGLGACLAAVYRAPAAGNG